MKVRYLVLVVWAVLIAPCEYVDAALMGTSVRIQYLFPGPNTVYRDSSPIIVGEGIELLDFSPFMEPHSSVDVSDTQIKWYNFDWTGQTGGPLVSAVFNGIGLEFTNAPTITGVTIDALSNMVGLDVSRVTFDEDTVRINAQGLRYVDGVTQVVLNVTTSNPVPEPATLSIWGTLGGLGLIAARRRRQVA